jgi:predicted nucleotidyltransferase
LLFRSARAEQRDDSDIDFLVVLKGETVNPFKEIALANPVLSGFLFRYGKVFSLVATSEERFTNYNNSFFHHERSEGIEI